MRIRIYHQVIILILTGALLTGPTAAAQPSAAGTTVARTITAGGRQRTYLLYLPPAAARRTPMALLFVLHGGGGTGQRMSSFTGFSGLADRHGFAVVYPDAVDRNWNDGREAQQIRAQHEEIDDVAFFAAMIDALSKELPVDPDRIYATGISNGGFMSQLLAVRLSHRLAAIAAVAAGMAPSVAEQPPKEPISVLVMNGTEDRLVPYRGGDVVGNRGKTIATDKIVQKWKVHNQCAEGPVATVLPDKDPSDGTTVTQVTYTRCARGTEVVLYTIEGGGHTWPGGAQYLPARIVGRVSRDISATEVIWQFFARHPRKKS